MYFLLSFSPTKANLNTEEKHYDVCNDFGLTHERLPKLHDTIIIAYWSTSGLQHDNAMCFTSFTFFINLFILATI